MVSSDSSYIAPPISSSKDNVKVNVCDVTTSSVIHAIPIQTSIQYNISTLDYMSTSGTIIPSDRSITSDNTQTSTETASAGFDQPLPLQFIRSETKGTISTSVYSSPHGTSYWVPDVDPEYIPVLYSTFENWDDIVNMYNIYASKSGFSTRIGTTKSKKQKSDPNDPSNLEIPIPTHRYILCSKEGTPKMKDFDSSAPPKKFRRTRFTVTGCQAHLKVRFDVNTKLYTIYGFIESHNHCMVSSDNSDLLKQNRKLGYDEQQFIHKVSLNKIGPNIAHNLQVSLKGGPQNVRGTKVDFKNCSRDIRLFIGERDAQIVLDTMNSRVTNLKDFFFDYVVIDNELRSFFWVDFVSFRNYEAFGDVCAFDATYDTNKYGMIFVPFTGVDHHKNCVTFGAGMLYDETIESYTWLLTSFLSAHKKQPTFVLTDQDAAMKHAVSTVFTESIHRLCMWHIMRKLPSKISSDLYENTSIRSSIHKLVWNLFITPEMFEQRWDLLMDEYNLNNHKWLCEMYNIRHEWVPCYFREIPMCCLMKTTSRCESSNARFKVNSKETNTLVQFLLCFDTSIDAQRNTQRKLEFQSDTSVPNLTTHQKIESHAAEIYTWNMFNEVRKEIYMCMFHCMPIERPKIPDEPNWIHYTVRHCKRNMSYVNEFEVKINVTDQIVHCTCMGYTRIGYLCRHAFCIFRYNTIERIPPHYIQSRWRRDALPSVVHSISNMYSSDTSEYGVLKNEITDMVTQCTNRLRRNPEQLRAFCSDIKKLRNRIFDTYPIEPKRKQKTANISDILNIPATSTVNIRPPTGIKNKGSGTKKQRVRPDQKVRKKRRKAARHCNTCDKFVYDHDSRNCAKVQAAKLAARKAKRDAAIAAGLPVLPEDDELSDNDDDNVDYSSDDSNDDEDEVDDFEDNDDAAQPSEKQQSEQPINVNVTRHSSRSRKTIG